jgi:hypothetical protein
MADGRLVGLRGDLGVAGADQEPGLAGALAGIHERVMGRPGRPGAGWAGPGRLALTVTGSLATFCRRLPGGQEAIEMTPGTAQPGRGLAGACPCCADGC